ncbi:cytidylyltransferase domain-containing protein [Candidatus Omnitrophota bacterium]
MGKPARRKPVILGIIPARKGSKRLSNKNIRFLLGRPLIAYTIRAALKSRLLDKVIVSTDDRKIAKIARSYGAEVPFIRPKYLAEDDTPMVPVLKHAVRWVEKSWRRRVAMVVLLQPTSPLRSDQDIDRCIRMILRAGADSLVTVCKAKEGCRRSLLRRLKGDSLLSYRQPKGKPCKLNGAFYAVKRDILIKRSVIYGKDTRAVVMASDRSVDIDRESDLAAAEIFLRKKKR